MMNSMQHFDTSSSSHESSQGSAQGIEEPMALFNMSCQGIRAYFTEQSLGGGMPYLKVTEEPVEKFRFRYKSEMMGTHGSILARSHERNRRKIYPSVQLCNYNGPAVIRCSLYTAHPNEKMRTPHTHRLIVRAENNTDKDDPHEMIVSQDNNFTAVFHGMGIIHTAKKNIVEELIKKKQNRLLEKLRAKNINNAPLTIHQLAQLRLEAEDEARKMNLNSVSLCFEAFTRDSNDCLHQICEPVYSKPINNMKSALTGELKICRIDKTASSALGGEEIFILVEKVGKKNIQIKFFEVNEDDTEVWHAYGKFSELDVHHQYAIVFRSPPYRCTEIEKPVDVYVQLYRPTDGDRSDPIPFQYKPSEKISRARKRQRLTIESLNSGERNSGVLNGSNGLINSFNNVGCGPILNPNSDFPSLESLSEYLGGNNDPEFTECFKNLSDDFILPQSHIGSGSIVSETFKMPAKYDVDSTCTAAYACNRSDIAFPGGFKTEGMIPRDYFNFLELEDLAEDGEQSSTESNEASSLQNNVKEKIVNTDEGPFEKEQSSDISLIQKSLFEVERILSKSVSQTVLTKKIQEIFAVTNDDGENALHAVVTGGQSEILELILQVLERGRNSKIINSQNANAETALHLAVLNNQPAMVDLLVNKCADPYIRNKKGNTPIHVAVENGHNECLTELLKKKNYSDNIKPNYNIKNDSGQSPLHLSILKNNLFAVKSLIEAGADVNDYETTTRKHSLILAAECGFKNIVEYLVKETSVDVNLMNYAGYTALHYACVVNDKGSPDICNLLIEAKADPRKVNYEQRCKAADFQALRGPEYLNVEIKEEIKEEIESEDDLQLHIDDEDEDDENDEDEENGDTRKGQSSMDLARNNKEILEILKKADVTNSVISVDLTDLHIKTECESPAESVTDNGLFDEETLANVCSILDSSKAWINLADLLDYTFLVPSIKNATSPTKLLFNYADLHGNVTVQSIRNFLEALDEKGAVEAIDLMLARRISDNPEN